MDQPGKVASPARRGQLNTKMEISLSALFMPENFVSRDGFGSPVPRSLLISILERVNLVLTYGIPPEFRGSVHLLIYNRHTPSGQSRVYRVTRICVPMAFTVESPPARGQ